MRRGWTWVGALAGLILVVLVVAAGGSLLMGLVTMLIWNGLIAPAIAAPEIGFGLAWGCWFLLSSLIGLARSSVTVRRD